MLEGQNNQRKAQTYLLPWLMASVASAALVLFLAPWILPLSIRTPTQGGSSSGMELFDVVRGVRADLIRLQAELIERQEAALFQIESVDVELSFVVKRDSSVDVEGGAAKLLVVSADSAFGTQQIQKVHVRMSLVDPGEPNIVIEGIPLDAEDATRLD